MSQSASPEMTRHVSSRRSRREANRARCAERALLDRILDVEPEALAVAEVRPDRLRQERDRHDDVGEAVLAEQLEDVLHARLADDRHHRLRLVRRQRAQAGAFAARHHDGLHARHLSPGLEGVLDERDRASAKPAQKIQSGHIVPSCVTIDETEARVEQPGCGLPDQVHLKLVAAAEHDRRADQHHEVAQRDQERRPRQPAGVEQQEHGRVDHQPVGERVGELAERGLDVPAAREVAVDLVGDPGDRRRRSRRATSSRRRRSGSGRRRRGAAAAGRS